MKTRETRRVLGAALLAAVLGSPAAGADGDCTTIQTPFGPMERCAGEPDRLTGGRKVVDGSAAPASHKPNGGKPVDTRRRGDMCATSYDCDTEYLDADDEAELRCLNIAGLGNRLFGKDELAALPSGRRFYGCGGKITRGYFTRLGSDGWPELVEAAVEDIVEQGLGCGATDPDTGELEKTEFGVGLAGGYQCLKLDGKLGWTTQVELVRRCRERGTRPTCHVVAASRGTQYCSSRTCPSEAGSRFEDVAGSGVGECMRHRFNRPLPECKDATDSGW